MEELALELGGIGRNKKRLGSKSKPPLKIICTTRSPQRSQRCGELKPSHRSFMVRKIAETPYKQWVKSCDGSMLSQEQRNRSELKIRCQLCRLPTPPATEGLLMELPLSRSKLVHVQAATSAMAAPHAETESPSAPSGQGPLEPHVYVDGTGLAA